VAQSSKAAKDKWLAWNKGKAWSEDTKAKMSDSAKQRKKRKQ
jgi:hypothetical protein